MTRHDASCTTLVAGLLALWMGLTNAMLDYLRASMRPWLIAAAVALCALGIYGLVSEAIRANREPHRHDGHWPRMGWFLVIPVLVVIVTGHEPLGSFAAGRSGTRGLPKYAFDIAEYAQSTGTTVPKLEILDVFQGADQPGNRAYLLDHDVSLLGFVTREGPAVPNSFVLNRFLISCCAADATALSLRMVGSARVPTSDAWVRVRARLLPTFSGGTPRIVMQVKSVQSAHAPSNPYEGYR
ncbi:MAG TPA: TIGR03943 family protein [Acidimicrobiia bacterium]|jgi:putative membrane protein